MPKPRSLTQVLVTEDPHSILRKKRQAVENEKPTVWIVPPIYELEDLFGNIRIYELSTLERIFVTLDDPTSSVMSRAAGAFTLMAVIIAIIFLVLQNEPAYKTKPDSCEPEDEACYVTGDDETICACEPQAPDFFEMVQEVCAYVFCVDYFARMLLVGLVPTRIAGVLPKGWEVEPTEEEDTEEFREAMRNREDPELAWYLKVYRYGFQAMNLVDLAAILPFLMEKMKFSLTQSFSTGFIRMLRLARVFRIFKIGKNNQSIHLLFLTLSKSLPALMLMGFFLTLGLVIFGSTMFICEMGDYTFNHKEDEFGNELKKEFVRLDLYGDKREISPFTSIPVAFYWAITTATTVGYGDLFPTTSAGRFVCMLGTFCAIIVLALPVSVIGNNFNREYDNMKSGKFDIVVESLVELLNQEALDTTDVDEEHREYMLSRKCLAITAIADHMTNTVQAEKVKTALRLRGYEKALERTRLLAAQKGRRVSLSHPPQMGSVPTLDRSPGGTFIDPNEVEYGHVKELSSDPARVRKIASLTKQLREVLDSVGVKNY